MKCICGGKLQIIETRGNDYTVYRIRRCPVCDEKVATKEEKIDYKEGRRLIRKIHFTRYGKREPFTKKKRIGRRLG